MEFRDLKRQYLALQEEINSAMFNVANEGNFISGKQVSELEKELAEYVGVRNCITCANGTDALSIALMAWNIGKDDAVFVPDFTFFATGEVVKYNNATPVFVDVDFNTYNMSAISLEEAICKVIAEGKLVPKVIITVDLFGLPADYDAIDMIAKKYNLLILEDGAQGFGGSIRNRKACSFGEISTTSFFPAKPLGCYGDGGAIFTNNDNIAESIRSICVHGKGADKYDNVRIGLNSRLDTIQAAILKVKLSAFKNFELENVNDISVHYNEMLKDYVDVPVIKDDFHSSWAQYTIKLDNIEERNNLQIYLKSKEIPSMIYYPKSMHKQSAFRNSISYVNCSVSEMLCDRVLSLPMHPYMLHDEIELVCDTVKEYLRQLKK